MVWMNAQCLPGNGVLGNTVRRFIIIWCSNHRTWVRYRLMRYVSSIKVVLPGWLWRFRYPLAFGWVVLWRHIGMGT
jgi:hypothetical protein